VRKRIHWPTIYAGAVATAAVLTSAYQGSLDWMAMLLLLFFLVPSFRRSAMRFLRGNQDVGRD
jgi:hypothetical protein